MKLYRNNKSADKPREIYKDEYLDDLSNFKTKKSRRKALAAFEKAWETRNFEIDLYWRRTNYFWALQIPIFAAYFALLSSDKLDDYKVILFLISCIGIIVSLAWKLINVGSKNWQRHWENHIDHLEDRVTGPLYKTISKTRTYSVSKINELVSLFFLLVWILLSIFYLWSNNLKNISTDSDFAFEEFFIVLITLFIVWQMIFEHGLGLFQNREVQFYRRKSKIKRLS
ncbi:hypothetical protein [Flagellimonas sediminis]|uniref:Uncharacterized protein n=1 Tax=Flagellimonas sediminis TaxID=2696468 RepID=A0A6I5KML2_9FLAO|nr:hypothetical protein [Allomuricauda sediminis]NDV42064.1 hypothetical protein [Allomuricauda sediminis]